MTIEMVTTDKEDTRFKLCKNATINWG